MLIRRVGSTLALVCVASASLHSALLSPAAREFVNNTGLSSFVGWDRYSFFLNGSRVFLQSGEMHPWRLPVPALWKDVLQKFKAGGLNAVSIYTHWALINPKKGVVDLDGFNDLQLFLDAARDAGVFVIARPGPYINAETTGGGVPGHVLTLPDHNTWFPYNGELRSNDTLFHDAWKDYITAVGTIIARNQVTNGGPVILLQIENEYYNGPGIPEYFAQLTTTYRDLGVVIPTIDNDPGLFRNLVDNVNIYGVDAYPVGFDCSNPGVWRDTPSPAWRPYHESVNPESPFFFPEFQGGSFDKWGSGGCDGCHQLTGVNFQRVYCHQLWASGVTAASFYMVFGGTNWGQLAYPPAVTSYDYSAAISESRQLTDKYGELKLQSMFLRSFPDFRKTDFVGEDNMTHPGIHTTHLRNPDTGAEWFISRHQVTNDSSTLTFRLDVGPSMTIPQLGGAVTLAGRDSVVTSMNLKFGVHSRLVYSTAALFSNLVIDGQDVLVAYGAIAQTFEIAVAAPRAPAVVVDGLTKFKTKFAKNVFILNFSLAAGTSAVRVSAPGMAPILLLVADYATATRFWMPTVPARTGANFFDLGASAPALVAGPYLTRSVSADGATLALVGDLDAPTRVTVLAPRRFTSFTWNGLPVRGMRKTAWGALEAALPEPKTTWDVPDLRTATWRYADSLPEISAAFDAVASGMVPANKTSTNNPFPPYYGAPWILYGSDYGFHSGNLVWRGTFEHGDGLTAPSAVNLSISGGQFFAASIWLNSVYLGASDTTVMTVNLSLPVTSTMLRSGENHVTVLQDHMGHNLAGQIVCCTPGGRQRDIQLPRGIQGYYLVGRDFEDQFTGWKVAGNLGGEDYPDKTRKILNEGGLFGERMGWHLPNFDDSHWEARAPWQGLDKPGVGWFRTTFNLSIPDDHDVPLAFEFAADKGQYRAQLYVNGWQMGKRIANQGPQVTFPVHPGILDLHGRNEVTVSLWALGAEEADLKIPSLTLVQLASFSGGPGRIPTNNPGWEELRGASTH